MAFHQYNAFKYNTTQYNSDAFFWIKSLIESIGSADTDANLRTKLLTEALSSADARALLASRSSTEFLFLLDSVSKSILNKGLPETVRINDWLQIERKRNSQWGN